MAAEGGWSRRDVLGFASALAVTSVAEHALGNAPAARRRAPRIRAICFDLFTLFDPRGALRAAEAVAPGHGARLWDAWRVRQFEYSWLRAAAGRYLDFEIVTREALAQAADAEGLSLSAEAARQLVAAYSELEPWPDTRDVLRRLRDSGHKLAPLANYSPKMLERLLAHAGLRSAFDLLISTDRAHTYKPDPRAYALGPAALGLPRERVAFAAFGGWDAAGAKWFGLPTFWVNRLGVVPERLTAPDASGPDLNALVRWVERS